MDSDITGNKGKKTIFVGGFPEAVTESILLETFSTFGDIVEVSMPPDPQNKDKHRCIAFITFTSPLSAMDAIDNYDLNELPAFKGQGKVLRVNLAKPDLKAKEGLRGDRAVWQTEEWLQANALPLSESGGQGVSAELAPGSYRAQQEQLAASGGDVDME